MSKVIVCVALATLLTAGCDRLAYDQSKPAEGAVTTVANSAAGPAKAGPAISAATSTPTPMNAPLRWLTTGLGSKLDESGVQGQVALAKGGILSVTALKSPITAGDTVTVSANITGPAGRQARVFVMRDCSSEGESDNSSVFADLTGAAQPVEVKHTFSEAYACVKFAIIAVGGEPIDLSITDLTFLRSAGSKP